jgi:hypothetical protein
MARHEPRPGPAGGRRAHRKPLTGAADRSADLGVSGAGDTSPAARAIPFPVSKTCGECGYDLSGLGSPVCPECGTPAPPEEIASPPRISRRARNRRRVLVGGVVGLILIFLLFPAVTGIYEQTYQLDLNSGDERIIHTALWCWTYTTPSTSAFSVFSRAQLTPLGPPLWRSYHYKDFTGSLRKNFRAGKLKISLMEFESALQVAQTTPPGIPLKEQARLGQVVLNELAAERVTDSVPTEDGGIEVLDADKNVLAEWHPAGTTPQ